MSGDGFENMATVLVDPAVLDDFELDLMSHDFRVWLVEAVPTLSDPKRAAFQIRRNLLDYARGAWDLAAGWTLVWITFGESWQDGDEPLPWAAHSALWDKLAEYSDHVRYNVGLGGTKKLGIPREQQH